MLGGMSKKPGYGMSDNSMDDFKEIKSEFVEEHEEVEDLYFGFTNIPASDKEPFEFVLEGEKIFTYTKDIPQSEVIVVDAHVNVAEFREIGCVVLNTIVKIPKLKVWHIQQFDISKSGE